MTTRPVRRTNTEYIGDTLYLKLGQPLDDDTWANGIVAFPEDGNTGSFFATVDTDKYYVIYRQLGTEPALGDESVDEVEPLLDGIVAEPTTDIPATESVPNMIAYLYGALRNTLLVNRTTGTQTYHNAAGSALWSKSFTDDGTELRVEKDA